MTVNRRASDRPQVLIVGAGVAGVETVIALRASGAAVDITVLAPGPRFVEYDACAAAPFSPPAARGTSLRQLTADFDAAWHPGLLRRVDTAERTVLTRAGERLAYDWLVLAPGAEVEPDYSGALVYSDWSDAPNYRLLMRKAEQHRVHSIAFVRPVGYTWLTPLYSLALLTAAHLRKAGVALKLVTPEDSPLGIFGASSADRVRGLLRSHGVSLYLGAYTGPGPAGEVGIQPGHRRTAADRVVRAPRLIRRPIAGLPCTADSFLVTDRYSRVRGVDRVLAVGDATSFPVKDASIAVQQADVAAAYIANRTGARVATPMFRPCVHADLLTASGSVELHADLSGCNGDARADRQAAQPGTDRGRRFRRSPRPAADLLSR